MSTPLSNVGPGDPLPRDAATWNAMIQAGRSALRPPRGPDAPRGEDTVWNPTVVVRVRNDVTEVVGGAPVGVALPAFAVVKIGAALIDPTVAPHAARETPVFSGTAPTDYTDGFAVLLEPAAPGATVRAAVLGVVPCQVRITNPGDGWAAPSGDTTTGALVSAIEGGPAKIWWRSADTGTVTALVLLQGDMGAGGPMSSVSAVYKDECIDGFVSRFVFDEETLEYVYDGELGVPCSPPPPPPPPGPPPPPDPPKKVYPVVADVVDLVCPIYAACRTVTADTTLDAEADSKLVVDAGAGAVQLQLPAWTTADVWFEVVVLDDTEAITVVPDGAEQINGTDEWPLDGLYSVWTIKAICIVEGEPKQWVVSRGPKGETGAAGNDGASAYAIALSHGFSGTESAWLASLVGPDQVTAATTTDLTGILVGDGATVGVTAPALGYDPATGALTCGAPPNSVVYTHATAGRMRLGSGGDTAGVMSWNGGGTTLGWNLWVDAGAWSVGDSGAGQTLIRAESAAFRFYARASGSGQPPDVAGLSASGLIVSDNCGNATAYARLELMNGGAILTSSAGGTRRVVGRLTPAWAEVTDSVRRGRIILQADDYGDVREVLRGEGSGSEPMIGFLGAGAVARQSLPAAGVVTADDIRAALIALGLCS